MARTVWEALQGAETGHRGRRSGEPVHRYTKTLAGQEGRFWQPFNRRHAARYLRAAERYDRIGRMAHRTARNGRQNGPLGHVALDVLRDLLRLVDFRTGRLDPAISTIASRIGRSVAAVHEALKRLRAHGFLTWLRRYTPAETAGQAGPQVRQTSNAYALMLPARAVIEDEPPLPEDELHRQATIAAEVAAMIESLPLFERHRAQIESEGLADALTALANAVAAREAAQLA